MTLSGQQIFNNYTTLLHEVSQKLKNHEGELRFNQAVARASDIAQQYFCEKKVELEHVLGKMETERQR